MLVFGVGKLINAFGRVGAALLVYNVLRKSWLSAQFDVPSVIIALMMRHIKTLCAVFGSYL